MRGDTGKPTRSPVLLSPLDDPREVVPLRDAGADELYAGVQPDGWGTSSLSASQRSFASAHLPSEAAFAETAQEATRQGVALHLTLNAPLYDARRRAGLLALAERAAGWGVRGVIVGDLELLAGLQQAHLPLEVTLSTTAGAMNRFALQQYRRFGIRRAVLPRHLTLAEMAALAASAPDVSCEAFVLIGRCPNAEAFCTFQHVSPEKRWPCEVSYSLADPSGNPLAPHHPARRWHERWARVERRFGCGLCAIPRLPDAGIRHLKLVGRGGPTSAKVANVELVAEFARQERSPEAMREAYRARFGNSCDRLQCYYPELYPPARNTASTGA